MIKAITFDLFDTLTPAADFERCRQQAIYEFICKRVCPVSFERFREVEKRHQAERFERICRTLEEVVYNDRFPPLFRELSGKEPGPSLVEEASSISCRVIADAIYFPPDVPLILERLARTYKLALISNFPVAKPVLWGLERTGISVFFDAVVISSDFGLAKPHPAIFLETAKCLGVDVSETAHVGDDRVCDVLGAANVGSTPILITQYQDEENIRLSGNPGNMRHLISHLSIDPEMDGYFKIDHLSKLLGVLGNHESPK